MRRRTACRVLALLGLSLAFVTRAQTSRTIPHIAYLSAGSEETNGALLNVLKASLSEIGYVDGKNIVIDAGWVGPNANEFPQLATAMVKGKPAALIGTCIPSTRAAKNASQTIPVVMAIDGDPVAAGLVASLARPGGNVTGVSTWFEALIPKWLELITAAVPGARAIAVLSDPDNVVNEYFWAQTKQAGDRFGIDLLQFGARQPHEIDAVFADMNRRNMGAAVVLTEAFLTSQQERIVTLAERHRLPAIFGYSEFAESGGLMSYGLSYRDYYRRVARYIDSVLKGVKPSDLPVEQPTKIELVLNLRAARKLALTLPTALRARADRVIDA